MDTSTRFGKQKVVEDYSSEDEEEETGVQNVMKRHMPPISHYEVHEKYKKNDRKSSRSKSSSKKQIRSEESSSDEYSKRCRKRSGKHAMNKYDETLPDRVKTHTERYWQGGDSSDSENYSKKETQKARYGNKDKTQNSPDRRDETRSMQKRMHKHNHSNRNEISHDVKDKQKQEKRRHKGDLGDDDYHKKDLSRQEEDANNRKSYRKDGTVENTRNTYHLYEKESDHEKSSKRKQKQKSYHQQDDDCYSKRGRKQATQNKDDSDCYKSNMRYQRETQCNSDSDESDYDKQKERGWQENKSSSEPEGNVNNQDKRKNRYFLQEDKRFSSDDESSEHRNHNKRRTAKKSKHHNVDEHKRNREKQKKSLKKSSLDQRSDDDDDYYKGNERENFEKSKYHEDDDGASSYSSKQRSQQYDSESYKDKQQIEKKRLQDDNNRRNYGKENSKSVQGKKSHDDSKNSDVDEASYSSKSRQNKSRWDSDQDSDKDQRDDRKISHSRYHKNSDESNRRKNIDRHVSNSGRPNSQKSSERDFKDSRSDTKKTERREKGRSSEVHAREEFSRNKNTTEHVRKEKENESSAVQNREKDNNEPTRNEKKDESEETKKKNMYDILSRTGGAYIPPARLWAMQEKITDKSSIAYQRIAWEALKKSINGLINKVNVSNLKIITTELFKENIVRAKGILARSIMQAQAASPTFTHVYAAVVAVINSKFPDIAALILKRLVIQFRRSFRRNDKEVCLACTNFIAHLVNQKVAHEVLALEILTVLLENITDDSVELAVGFLKECGLRLSEATRQGTDAIFERLRSILHDGEVDKRVQYMIEVMFAVRKDKFKDHPIVIPKLDVLEEEDVYTHTITLEEVVDPEDILNVFKHDPEYESNEAIYEEIKKAVLPNSDSEEENSDDDSSNDNDEDEENENETQQIIDSTETCLISLRRTIYLTIQSSLDFEECAHKLLKLELKPGQIVELCYMILDCCAQQRTYEKFFGLLAQRFCQINKVYVEPFEEIFKTAYDTIHRFETNKLRNVARFFAHLFYTDAISWQILAHIKLNEDETTSSSRIFVKILFQELCEYMGLLKLNERVKDPTMQEAFEGLFPRDSPRNTRFAINFFTSIGLGGLTDELREHLKTAPKATTLPPAVPLSVNSGDNSNSSEEEKSILEGSSSSTSSSSEEEPREKKAKHSKKKHHNKHTKKKKKRK